MCHNFSLQYITHRNSTLNDIDSSKLALEGGCKWVQLRMKGYSDQEFIDNALKLGKLCDSFGATFLLNDKAHLVNECNAHGVHLGKNDIAPSKAREMLGDKAIIGGTANTCQDIDYLVAQGVDYIGLGPFRFTTTKDNLSPVLGFEGYKAAIAHCKDKGYTTPIVAIGGITIEDINKIMSCGVSGIALSGTILNAQDSTQTTREIMTILADKRK
ncbi:MAG: thiamine phosphate synthase [Rikenellaceae bacterium]